MMKILRTEHQAASNQFMSNKTCPIPTNLLCKRLTLKDQQVKDMIYTKYNDNRWECQNTETVGMVSIKCHLQLRCLTILMRFWNNGDTQEWHKRNHQNQFFMTQAKI